MTQFEKVPYLIVQNFNKQHVTKSDIPKPNNLSKGQRKLNFLLFKFRENVEDVVPFLK